jgi:uncharacterized Zn finger protein
MDSLKQLLAGKFPKELETLFIRKGTGLFPAPEEIGFSCSCPDSAYMCKHVAAALYGIGTRLDQDPGLFFTLRKVNVAELISETIKDSKADLLEKSRKKSARVLEDDSLSDLFGIDLHVPEQKSQVMTPPAIVRPAKEKPAPKKIETKKAATKKAATKKAIIKKPVHPDDLIFNLIRKHKQGVRVLELIDQSKLDPVKVRNIIVKLKQKGKIENIDRGVYKVS